MIEQPSFLSDETLLSEYTYTYFVNWMPRPRLETVVMDHHNVFRSDVVRAIGEPSAMDLLSHV